MIIRVAEELLKALCPETPLIAHETPESIEAARLAPGWIREGLLTSQGRIIIVPEEDFRELPFEVSQFCEIIG